MSWAEAKWAVDKVNTKLDESEDAGKDMYIRGIRRPKVVKQVRVASSYSVPGSSNGTITGSGWLTAYSLYLVGSTSGHITITLDNDPSKKYGFSATGKTETQSRSFALTSGGSLVDELPIRFERSLTWSMHVAGDPGYSSTGSASFQYILDDGGGRSHLKFKSKISPGGIFVKMFPKSFHEKERGNVA